MWFLPTLNNITLLGCTRQGAGVGVVGRYVPVIESRRASYMFPPTAVKFALSIGFTIDLLSYLVHLKVGGWTR
jgi:hypothetical protein